MTGGGLRPPAPSSNEPSGIPTRPTDDTEPIPVGDEADAAGPANELLPIVGQAPDAVPVTPPPSKTEVEPEVPAVDVPVIPVIELPMPDIVPTVEPPVPKEVCGIEPPMPAALRDRRLCRTSTGSRRAMQAPLHPAGTPVGATGEPGPMPSGDVMPSGGEVPVAPTCADGRAASPRRRRQERRRGQLLPIGSCLPSPALIVLALGGPTRHCGDTRWGSAQSPCEMPW